MNSKQRIQMALECKQPDKVPIWELQIDEPIVLKLGKLLGLRDKGLEETVTFVHGDEKQEVLDLYCSISKTLGLDATCTVFSAGMKDLGAGYGVDKYGCRYRLSALGEPIVIEGPIKSMDDLKGYDMASRLEPRDFAGLQAYIRGVGQDRAHFLAMNDPFKVSWMVRGDMANLMTDFAWNPQLAHALGRVTADFLMAEVDYAVRFGCDGIVIEGDLAGEKTTLMSPNTYRKFIKPYQKEVVDYAHKRGLKAIKHSDGNMMPILEDLVEVGFDAFNPVQPQCMDIAVVKKQLQGRMAIIGNIDCRNLLPFGSEQEVEEVVRRTIEIAKPGGGYIISSSNSIHAGCKPENYIAMVRAAHQYGAY